MHAHRNTQGCTERSSCPGGGCTTWSIWSCSYIWSCFMFLLIVDLHQRFLRSSPPAACSAASAVTPRQAPPTKRERGREGRSLFLWSCAAFLFLHRPQLKVVFDLLMTTKTFISGTWLPENVHTMKSDQSIHFVFEDDAKGDSGTENSFYVED